MSLQRVAALGRALVVVIVLALSALASTADASDAGALGVDGVPPQEQPTIEAREVHFHEALRAGEQVRLVSSGAPSDVRPPASGDAPATAAQARCAHRCADAMRWFDVVQCRRLDGALLLGYATPPPRRR
jgi:hypothetical protein